MSQRSTFECLGSLPGRLHRLTSRKELETQVACTLPAGYLARHGVNLLFITVEINIS